MGGKMDKPDYVDQDWTSLTEVKTAKWADMMEEIKEEGSVSVRDTGRAFI